MDGNERKISAGDWPAEEARELILDDGAAMSNGVKRQDMAKKLGLF